MQGARGARGAWGGEGGEWGGEAEAKGVKQCIWSVLYIHGVCMAYMQRTLMTSGMWSDGWTALHGAAQNAGSVGVGKTRGQ